MVPFKANEVVERVQHSHRINHWLLSNTTLLYHRLQDGFSFLSPQMIHNIARIIAVIPTERKQSSIA